MLENKNKISGNSEAEEINIDFYDSLYKKRNVLLQLIYPYISFDQQSKSIPNYHAIKFLFKNLKKETEFNLLDYGFGHGSFLLKIPRKTGLFGCDISVEAVRNFPPVAKMLGKIVKTFTPRQLEGQKVKFDIISLSHVIEHVDNDFQLLSELAQFIKPDGYFLINVPVNEVWEDPKHVRKYTSDSLLSLLEKVGFKSVSVTELDKWSAYLLIHEKVGKSNRIGALFFRSLRLFLALIPYAFLRTLENLLGEKYKHQQLIVLARKNG